MIGWKTDLIIANVWTDVSLWFYLDMKDLNKEFANIGKESHSFFIFFSVACQLGKLILSPIFHIKFGNLKNLFNFFGLFCHVLWFKCINVKSQQFTYTFIKRPS